MCMIKCDLDMLITCANTKGEKDVYSLRFISPTAANPTLSPCFPFTTLTSLRVNMWGLIALLSPSVIYGQDNKEVGLTAA